MRNIKLLCTCTPSPRKYIGLRELVGELQKTIPIRDAQTISSRHSAFYNISNIKCYDPELSFQETYGFCRFSGIKFNLLFGEGILEFDRQEQNFDFIFGYETKNHNEKRILESLRTSLKYTESQFFSDFPSQLGYQIRVYPADINSVKKAFEDISLINERLRSKSL